MNYFNNIFNNSFMGYYVNSYDEVLNMAAPTDGSPILFANLDQGLIWSKKQSHNGVPTIQPYKITPIYQENTEDTSAKSNSQIIEMLRAMKTEIETLKGELSQ